MGVRIGVTCHRGLLQMHFLVHLSQFTRLWYLSHRRPAKAQASLRIRAVSSEPSLFAHMKYGSRRRIRPNIRHLAPLDGCAWVFWRMSLRRMKSAIISWDGSFHVSWLHRMDYFLWKTKPILQNYYWKKTKKNNKKKKKKKNKKKKKVNIHMV